MPERLREVEKRYEELMARLCDPAVTADAALYRSLMQDSSDLLPLVEAYRTYTAARRRESEARELLDSGADEELRELANDEWNEARAEAERLTRERRPDLWEKYLQRQTKEV